jgi:hypothetical protein
VESRTWAARMVQLLTNSDSRPVGCCNHAGSALVPGAFRSSQIGTGHEVLNVTRDHFLRAACEIGQSGENDTLPYDVDAAFIRDKAEDLSNICSALFQLIDAKSVKDAAAFMNGLTIGSERLLVDSF